MIRSNLSQRGPKHTPGEIFRTLPSSPRYPTRQGTTCGASTLEHIFRVASGDQSPEYAFLHTMPSPYSLAPIIVQSDPAIIMSLLCRRGVTTNINIVRKRRSNVNQKTYNNPTPRKINERPPTTIARMRNICSMEQ